MSRASEDMMSAGVAFSWEAARQDSHDHLAVLVWPPGVEPGTPRSSSDEGDTAYQSTLTIRWND